MSRGWIRVTLPPVMQRAARWRVEVEGTCAAPGEDVPVPAGTRQVVLCAAGFVAGAAFHGTLSLTVPVEPGRTTGVYPRIPPPG